jgi:hypothetical protein
MTNKHLIKNWRKIAIRFKSSQEVTSLSELFLVCVGESEIDVEGKNELVVAFFQGYDEKGSPAVFFNSDDKDRCWTFAHKDGTHVKANIGSFVNSMPEKKKKNKKRKLPVEDEDV